jgi:hypothetical protein
MITLYLADFAIGLFVGTLAQSAIAPARQARQIFTGAWYMGGLFIILAFLDSKVRGAVPKADLPSVETLVTLVILGIIAGLLFAKKIFVQDDSNPSNTPEADAPKADAPKADAPKADAPKADASVSQVKSNPTQSNPKPTQKPNQTQSNQKPSQKPSQKRKK